MTTESLIAARKARWHDFVNGGAAPRHLFWIDCPFEDEPRPLLWRENYQARIDWMVRKYEQALARTAWLDDDAVPHLDMLTGTEIFAEAFGCSVHKPLNDMPSARPLVTTAQEADKLKSPELSTSSLAYLFDMIDEMHKRLGHKAMLRMIDVQSPMDIAALIWDKTEFYIALMETPEAVTTLAAKVHDLLVAFHDEWFRRYGTERIAHYPLYLMRDGITLSEDEVGCVSTDQFAEYFLPELQTLSARYGGLGMHCCANARHQWGGFKQINNLKMLNIVHNREMITDARSFFADSSAQIHCWNGDGPPETWPQHFPKNSRMVIELTAHSRDEAVALADKMRVACRRSL